jgi:hypothetical protein
MFRNMLGENFIYYVHASKKPLNNESMAQV